MTTPFATYRHILLHAACEKL